MPVTPLIKVTTHFRLLIAAHLGITLQALSCVGGEFRLWWCGAKGRSDYDALGALPDTERDYCDEPSSFVCMLLVRVLRRIYCSC